MGPIRSLPEVTARFVVNYCHQHAHPVNAALHLTGVPMVGLGLYKLLTRRPAAGWSLVALGYLFQFVGHDIQGTEVGEVTLIKKFWRRFAGHSAS